MHISDIRLSNKALNRYRTMNRPRFLSPQEMEDAMNDDTESDVDDDDDFSSGSGDDYNPLEDLQSNDSEQNDDDGDDWEQSEDADVTAEAEAEDVAEDSEDSEDSEVQDPLYVSKDGTIWQKTPTERSAGRNQAANIIRLRPGMTNTASSRVSSMKDAFLLFYPPLIEKIILDNTNAYGRLINDKHEDVDVNLLHAYFAVLLLSGIYKYSIHNLNL